MTAHLSAFGCWGGISCWWRWLRCFETHCPGKALQSDLSAKILLCRIGSECSTGDMKFYSPPQEKVCDLHATCRCLLPLCTGSWYRWVVASPTLLWALLALLSSIPRQMGFVLLQVFRASTWFVLFVFPPLLFFCCLKWKWGGRISVCAICVDLWVWVHL